MAPEPLPAEGGSYLRNPDGTLTRVADQAPGPDEMPAPPAVDTATPV